MSSQAGLVVEAKGVAKQYGSVNALSGLDLNVQPGEVYGLLGPNGAGKTTFIKIVTGLVEPTYGYVRVMGYDPSTNPLDVKSLIGYVPETSVLYESLSPRDLFEFVASVRKIDQQTVNDRARQLATALGLAEYYDSPIATLSMGTRQKVSIIASLIHNPQLLVLDEPLNGLDAKSSRIVKDLIQFHSETSNGAVLFSTHIMEVAEHVCTRIGIIYQGKIVAEGSMEQLRSKAGSDVGGGRATLEEVFLKLTHEEEEITESVKVLREAFRPRKQ